MSSNKRGNLKWGCCTVGLQDKNFIQCTQCAKAFHLKCVSLPSNENGPSTSAWLCPLCQDEGKQLGNNDNTPVRFNPNIAVRPGKRQALNSPPNVSNDKPVTTNEMQEIMKGIMSEFQKTMRNTISAIMSEELKSLKEEIKDLKDSMNFMNSKYEAITKEHEESRDKIKRLEIENNLFQSKVDDLSNRINQAEQNARINNIEIQCVPERKEENLLSIITELGKSLNCQISEEHLTHYTRIAKLNKDSSRPRSIVVQFSSARMRDHFLAAAIKFNKMNPHNRINSSHVGLSGTKTPIFVCEHLSSTNKALHAAARQAARDKGYKYIWIRGGRIYMRKTDDSEFKIIRNMDTLDKLL